jgi:hypothetical protein
MSDRFDLILNMTADELMQAKLAYRLKAMISRAGAEGILQSNAFNKLGLGVTASQFNDLVERLVAQGWCTRSARPPRGQLLVISDVFKNVNVPEPPDKF